MSFRVFTSGYSDQFFTYKVDEKTRNVEFDKAQSVGPQSSFGHVSQSYNSVYFVYTVTEYDGNPDTGAVSRWTMDDTLTEKEVRQILAVMLIMKLTFKLKLPSKILQWVFKLL